MDGERKSVSGKTKKEVADKLAELRVSYNCGKLVKKSNITFKELSSVWLRTKVKSNLSEQSFIRLEASFSYHLYPIFGNEPIQNITKSNLEEYYATIFFKKGRDGKKYKEDQYSHSTVNALSIQVKKCFQYAVQEGLLSSNPHDGVELHKLREPKKVSSYTSDDQQKIISACKKGLKKYRIFYLLISTGMRFGEVAALTWDDVDLKTGKITINKTAVSIHGSMVIQNKTKTNSGMRTIFVGENIIDWLREQYNEQDHDLNYRNLVCPNMRYNITNQANAIALWKRLCAELEIEYQGMHSLRHTWATRALESGIDVKTVSKMLGHKNVITTMNIYQDVLDPQKKNCAEQLNNLF